MKKLFPLISMVVLSLILAACAKPHFSSTSCKVVNAHPEVSSDTVNTFAKEGIIIIPKGQLLRVIIPADRYFQTNLPALKENKKPVLNQLADLLKQYPTCSVKITGYTDNLGDQDQLKALSLNRARSIQTYLWTQGLDAEHLYAIGEGSNHSVADFRNPVANAANRRVEITVHANCTVCY